MVCGGRHPAAFRAEHLDHFLDERTFETRNAVLRGHNVDSALLRMFRMTNVKAVLSYRDPRDAVTSFVQRFQHHGASFNSSCTDVARNLASLLSATQSLYHLSYFYEDAFMEKLETIGELAHFLELEVPKSQLLYIFEKYQASAVRSFIKGIPNLPDDRLFVDETQNAMDRETSFHQTHISDMKVGKWRDALSDDQKNRLQPLFNGYAKLLEAREFAESPFQPSTMDGLRTEFDSTFFAKRHDGHPLNCKALLSPLGIKVLCLIFLPQGLWRLRIRIQKLSQFHAITCQNGNVVHQGDAQDGELVFEFKNKLHDHPLDINVTYNTMKEDAEVDSPPPTAVLEAVYRPDAMTCSP